MQGLDDCLAFALEHSTPVGNLTASELFDREPALSDLQYRRAEPIFTADGRSARVKHTTLKRTVLDAEQERNSASIVRSEQKPNKKAKQKDGERPESSGASHFDLPNTPMTPDLERTFQLLEMRPYIYKDQHYKRMGKWKAPAYFGVGTVVDDAKDFYSSRTLKKDRKQSLADEFLEDPAVLQYVEARNRMHNDEKKQRHETRQAKGSRRPKSKKSRIAFKPPKGNKKK